MINSNAPHPKTQVGQTQGKNPMYNQQESPQNKGGEAGIHHNKH
jgi:hypothetical protein